MSKLSELAWRRNGIIGRLTGIRNQIRAILNKHTFTNSEIVKINEALILFNEVLDNHKESWKFIKTNLNDTN